MSDFSDFEYLKLDKIRSKLDENSAYEVVGSTSAFEFVAR